MAGQERPMRPPIQYTVDDEPQTTTETELTPRHILTNAGFAPDTYYLILVHGQGQNQDSFRDKLDEPIHMHPQMKFITNSLGPTPVS